ncbi:MAG TPA: DUF983 domain-containing protein [Alphaproteobacteria bacterium]|nr:DUF983 domain-containing protein [Alphaproteobacteria bacterium]
MDQFSPFQAGLQCRCPRCGQGRLFDGILAVRERCAVCDFDLRANDVGDGAAVFVILILGFIVVGLALLVEAKVEPPLWVHAVIWPIVIFAGTIGMLRPLKGTLIALQYRHRRDTFDAT